MSETAASDLAIASVPAQRASRRPYLLGVAALWSAVALLWAGEVVSGGGAVVFMLGIGAAILMLVGAARRVTHRSEPWLTSRKVTLLALLVVVPSLFDVRSSDSFNLPRYTVIVVASFLIGLSWLLDWLRHRRLPFWRNGLAWPVLALLAWTAVTTATSIDPRLSLLGDYSSYDGLYSATAFTVLFFGAAEAFNVRDVKVALSVLYFGGGSLSVLYGLMQLHDRTWDVPRWDWVEWGSSLTFSKNSAIWSTFGNPNHLAGFLSIILPVGLVLFLIYKSWWVRSLIVLITTGLVLEILHTSARGAWIAGLAALTLVALLLLPDLKKRPRVAVSLATSLITMVIVAALALGSTREVTRQLGSIFDFSSGSTASKRGSFWGASVRIANDRPVVGAGPDTFPVLYTQYKNEQTNGPHNVIMNYLASQGYPGAALFAALLCFAALRAIGAVRRLRFLETRGAPGQEAPAREARFVLTAVVAALGAYVVQASFNVQQVGLTFLFWVLLGLASAVALAAGVPHTLRPGRLVARPAGEEPNSEVVLVDRAQGLTTSAHIRREGSGGSVTWRWEPVAAILGLIALLGFTLMVSRPYRADQKFRSAAHRDRPFPSQGSEPIGTLQFGDRAMEELEEAIALNPWEPLYFAQLGERKHRSARQLPAGPLRLDALTEARAAFARATRLAPRDAVLLRRYAQVLLEVHAADYYEEATGSARAEAIAALRQAVRASPLDLQLAAELKKILDAPAAP